MTQSPDHDDWTDDVLKFWFEELSPEQWYKRDDAVDAQIRARFASAHETVRAMPVTTLTATPHTALAAIIVLDQFSRNMFRDSPRAFESDAKALEVAGAAIDGGLDQDMSVDERQFVYMPFMHSEALADQDRCIALFETLGKDEPLKYAHLHRDVIVKFGRFPHRNTVLGRTTTEAEQAHLDEHGGF